MTGDIVIDYGVWGYLTEAEQESIKAWLIAEGTTLHAVHYIKRVDGEVTIVRRATIDDGGFVRHLNPETPLPPLPSVDDRMVVLPPLAPGEDVVDYDEFHKVWSDTDKAAVRAWVADHGIDINDVGRAIRHDGADWITVWGQDASGHRIAAYPDGEVVGMLGYKVRATSPCPLPQRVG